MNLARNFTLASVFALTMTLPALAGITVNSPASNTDVSSPFTLNASASTCSSSSVVTMGYSFDSSSDTTVIKGQSIDTIYFIFYWRPHPACKSLGFQRRLLRHIHRHHRHIRQLDHFKQ